MYARYIKRLIDIIGSLLLIIALSPVLLCLMIAIALTMGRPVFFFQKRGGKNNCVFHIMKFRTMRNAYTASGEPLPDFKRTTRLGAFLRKYSLDELPGLFNVLRGQMSMIGPRPFIADYLPHYNEFQKQRHLVRPGITGLAQVSGRNKLSWQEKFAIDVHYVKNISFLMDVKIAVLTLVKICKTSEINQDENTTATRFDEELKL